jgi:Annexin
MELSEQKLQNFKTIVIYSAVGLGTATGLFFLGRHFINKVQANQSQKDSLDEGDPATFAKQLKMAFDNDNYAGWGTNEKMVFKVFNELPSKTMYGKVQREYSRLYGKSLNADLEDELSSEEYNELIRILNAKK